MGLWQFFQETFRDGDGKVSSTRLLSFSAILMVFVLLAYGLISGENMDVDWIKWLLGYAAGNQGIAKVAERFKREAVVSKGKGAVVK